MNRCERRGSSIGARAAAVVVTIVAATALLRQQEKERRALREAQEATLFAIRAREAALRSAAEERICVARELHDVLGSSLGLIVVQAGAAAQLVDDDPLAVRRTLESIRLIGSRSLGEMREVVTALRDSAAPAARLGLDELPMLVARPRPDGLLIEFAERGQRPSLSPGAQLTLYRIAQEALTNVTRHAAARTARITVTHAEDSVLLCVADDGCGHSDGARGNGIAGMMERAALVGGTVTAGPSPAGTGWRVEARLPMGSAR